jgi:MinD-like ATPase involved in chromosome partitioning or flagellar assembly
MAQIISVHSFRGGTGKSNTTANLAALLAADGKRIGIVDTDIQSPGIHVLFGVDPSQVKYSLNDFLWGKCEIGQAAYDMSDREGIKLPGKLYLIPSSVKTGDIARVLHYGYDVNLLREGFKKLIDELNLQYLFIDTHPGLNEETLLSIALSDILMIILRPDQQDYQGTAVTVEVSGHLEVPKIFLVVNKIPSVLNGDDLKTKLEGIYNCPVAGMIPHTDELMILASEGIFSLRYPHHALTRVYVSIAGKLTV